MTGCGHLGSYLVPDLGLNPWPLPWKCRVLLMDSQGKSLLFSLNCEIEGSYIKVENVFHPAI